jgi:hypothetical protein
VRKRSGLGVSFFAKWTWKRELTCAGYGPYLVDQQCPARRLERMYPVLFQAQPRK